MHLVPRDSKTGRLIPWANTPWERFKKPRQVTLADVKQAFLDGFNAQGGVLLPSRKAEIYLKEKGFK